jgi:hypothetical protein
MNWFQSHAYVATWCSPLIAIIALLIRSPKNKAGETDWASIVLYIVFLSLTAVAATPGLDSNTSYFARSAWMTMMGVLAVRIAWPT